MTTKQHDAVAWRGIPINAIGLQDLEVHMADVVGTQLCERERDGFFVRMHMEVNARVSDRVYVTVVEKAFMSPVNTMQRYRSGILSGSKVQS